jgi:two-component system sensor histidine kinase QseC
VKSIRHELSFRLLTGVFLLLATAGAILATAMHTRLLAEFDAALLAKARALSALTSREGRGIEIDYSGEHLPEFEDEEAPEYFQMRLRNGPLIARSPQLHEARADLPGESKPIEEPEFSNVELPDGRDGRLVLIAFKPRVDPGEEFGDPEDEGDATGLFPIPASIAPGAAIVVLTVARGREELDALLFSLYATLALVIVVLLLAIAGLIRQATKRALRPIVEINAQVAVIGPGALDHRVSLATPPEELRTIISAINRLLERLERAFERERRFSSDVAHELRTPVSELRLASEVAGEWPEDPAAVRQFFSDVRDIAVQMETTVNNLLILAGCESGTVAITPEPVHLDELVRTCWSRAAADAATRDVRCELQIDADHVVRTDRRKLEMVVQNLVGNAAAYAAPASTVRLTAANGGARLELSIENKVDGLTPEDLQHVFDRFWRKDAARSANNHTGLGLSIAKALCDLLGIDLRIDLKTADVFCARLSFAPEARS